jgi:alkylhydroperoxidase family enzyme
MTEELKPRLRLANDDELPEKWRSRHDPITRVFGHNSRLLESWNKWYGPLIREGALPSRLKEMVRLRVAQLNSCDF